MDTEKILFNAIEAAQYLGIELTNFEYHLKHKHIRPDHRYVYLKSTLDDFAKRHLSQDYTMAEAAEYLGVSLSRIRDHIYVHKTIKPTHKRGKFRTFSKGELEKGRPIITSTPNRNYSPRAKSK